MSSPAQASVQQVARTAFVDRLLAASPECIYVYDLVEGRLVYRNHPLYETLGYKRTEVERPSAVIPAQFLADEDRIDVDRLLTRLRQARRGDVDVTEFRLRNRQGAWRHFAARLTPLSHDHRGRATEVLGMIADVTAQKAAEAQLKAACAAEAGEARRKERFLAEISHEIRTPLNGLLGAVGLLTGTRLDREQAELVGVVQRSGEALFALVENVLDHSKMAAGLLELDKRPTELMTLIDEAVATCAERVASKGLVAYVTCSGPVPERVLADATRLRQVLLNLLSNAVKFTDRGDVRIDVRARAGVAGNVSVRVSVHDQGAGIQEAQRQQLFQPYRQLKSGDPDAAHRGGTGLGLAICRQLVELMGGEIGIDGAAPHGSIFWFEVPFETVAVVPVRVARPLAGRRCRIHADHAGVDGALKQALEAAGATVVAGGAGVDPPADAVVYIATKLKSTVRARLDARARQPDAPPRVALLATPFGAAYRDALEMQARWRLHGVLPLPLSHARLIKELVAVLAGASKGRDGRERRQTGLSSKDGVACMDAGAGVVDRRAPEILIVDDNEENCRIGIKMIERCGFRARSAMSGREALQMIFAGVRPAAILIDCQMPDLNGWETTRALRRLGAARAIPIIAVTASATKESAASCMDAGMNEVLTKPLRLETLRQSLERWLVVAPESVAEAPPAASVVG